MITFIFALIFKFKLRNERSCIDKRAFFTCNMNSITKFFKITFWKQFIDINLEKSFISLWDSLSKDTFVSFKIPAQNFKVKIKTFIFFKGNFPKVEVLKKYMLFQYVLKKNIGEIFLNSSRDSVEISSEQFSSKYTLYILHKSFYC